MFTIIVFFTSLAGIIILFSYKLIVISKCESEQQDKYSELKVLPNTYHIVLHTISTKIIPVAYSVFFSMCSVVIKINKRLYQKYVHIIQKIKLKREDPGTIIEKKGIESMYIKEILEHKKIIQEENKIFHNQDS